MALAPFERVAAAIRNAVASGILTPGQKLDGNRALADEHGVSLPTLQRAVGLLQDEGWLVSRPSIGVFVAEDPPLHVPATSLSDVRRGLVEMQTVISELRERVDALEQRAERTPRTDSV